MIWQIDRQDMHAALPTLLLLFLFPAGQALAQSAPVGPSARLAPDDPQRHYRAVIAPVRELEMIALDGLSLNKGLQDAYIQGIGPHLGPAGPVVGTVWSATFTYLTTLWPHELGHWARGPQAGGRFVFRDYMPLFPTTTVELPDDATDTQRALVSVGGFEVNALMARRAELEFQQRGWAYSDELVHGLLQEAFFPIYAFLVIPRDPGAPATWTRTAGDPVHFVLPTWQLASGREPVRADGSVDPQLRSYYRETTLMALALPLVDPTTWQALLGFFDAHTRGHYATRDAWVLLGDRQLGWSFGTRFVPSVLGYEVHLDHYIHIRDRLVVVSPHVGRPSKNLGLQLRLPELVRSDDLRVGMDLDVWEQARYGFGAGLATELEYDLESGFGLFARLGIKSEGSLAGRRLTPSGLILAGVTARFPTNRAL